MRRDRLAGDDAALLERGREPPLGANDLARPRQRRMRLEPVQRAKAETLGDRAPLGFVRDQVEPLAVADLVEPKMVREAVGHSIFPSRDVVELGASRSRRRKRCKRRRAMVQRIGADVVLVQALACRLAQSVAPRSPRHSSVRRASEPTSLRTVLPERRIAEPELAMLGFHHLDEPLGQRHRHGIARLTVALPAEPGPAR